MSARDRLEAAISEAIDLLDMLDRAGMDREPDHDDEIMCEDEGVVRGIVALRSVGARL